MLSASNEGGPVDTEWFYARDGVRQGPVPADELRRLAAGGALRPHDLVWREGMPQWQPAGQATDFFPTAAAVPPPLPPAAPVSPYAAAAAAPPGAYPQAYGHPYGQPAVGRPLGDDAGVRMLLPVGRSGWAIAAGYLGLISVLAFPAPIALIVSIVAIRDIRSHPDRHGMGRAVFGLIMGILGTLLLAAGIVAVIADGRR